MTVAHVAIEDLDIGQQVWIPQRHAWMTVDLPVEPEPYMGKVTVYVTDDDGRWSAWEFRAGTVLDVRIER